MCVSESFSPFEIPPKETKDHGGTLSPLSTWSQVSTREPTLDTSKPKAHEMQAEAVSAGHTVSCSKMAMSNGGARPK